MADPIAEAFVRIRPDFTGFDTEIQRRINAAVSKVKLTPAAQQNVASQLFGAGFQQQSKTAISGAASKGAASAKASPATQRTLAQQIFGSAFRTEGGRAVQGALVGLGRGQLAAQLAFFGAGGAGIAALGAGFVTATRNAAELERSLDVLQAVTGATDSQIAALGAEAERLGASMELPAVTSQAAADAMLELSKAGLSIQNVLGGVEGVLQLATAANIDAGTAARIAASALNAFSLAGTEAVRVADLLAGASIAAQGDIGDMALALQQSAAVADQAGLSIDQLVAFITLLAKQGILGSDAGTSIRTSLLRLVPTTKEAAGFMEALGVQLDRTRTLGRQLPDLLDQYNRSLSALNPTLRQSVLQQIFGTDAIRAASVAIDGGSAAFEQARIEVDRQNAALVLAQAQTKGLSGSFAGLTSTAQTLSTEIGQSLSPVVEAAVTDLNLLAGALLGVEKAAGDVLGPVKRFFVEAGDAERSFIDKAIPGLVQFREFTDRLIGNETFFQTDEQELEKLKEGGVLLATALDEAIKLRAELLKLGQPTAPADTQITRLRAQLRALREEQKSDIGLDLATPLDRAIASAEKLRDALSQQGLKGAAAQVQRDIDFLSDAVARGAAAAAERATEQAAARNQLARALGFSASEVAQLTRTVETEGRRAGVALGGSLIEGMESEITAQEQRAINAARSTLEQIRREGEKQVQEAIRSARSNLESLGSTISESLAKVIDVGPIGEAIKKVEEQLDALQERVSRRQLRFDLTQAKTDLREAQEAIAQVGALTPTQKKSQEEFLEPFREKVLDAKAAAKEFDLTEQRDQLEKTKEKAAKAAEEGLQKLIERFEEGKVSAEEFNRLLRSQLSPAFDELRTKGGLNLGLVFTRDFKRDVEALIKQAQALSGFFPFGGGTTPGAQVVRPSDTQAQVNQRIAEAAASLEQIQQDAKELSKEEQDKISITNSLLRRLIRLIDSPDRQRGQLGR